jgi:hypothetical protein
VAAHPDDPVIAVAEAMAAPADERTPDALALVADLYAWTQEQGSHGSDCPYGRDIGEHPGDTSIKERKEKGCTCGLWDLEKRADAMLNGNRADPFPAPAAERTETGALREALRNLLDAVCGSHGANTHFPESLIRLGGIVEPHARVALAALSLAAPGGAALREGTAPWYEADGSTVMLPAPEVERRRKLAAKVIAAAREIVRFKWTVLTFHPLMDAIAALDAASPDTRGDATGPLVEGPTTNTEEGG